MYAIKRAKRSSHASLHIVTDWASLLTDQRMSGPPIRAKYMHDKTICEQTSDNSPLIRVPPACPSWWSSKQRMRNFVVAQSFLFANSQYRSTHFPACLSMSWDHDEVFAQRLSHIGNFSVAPADIHDSSIFVNFLIIFTFGLHSRWMHPNWTWTENDVGSSISTCFINFFHIGATFHCFPAILKSSTYTDRSNPCLRWANIHSQFGPYKFRSRGTTGSSILDNDLGHLCRGRRIQTFGHSEFGILSNLGASSNFTWELADTASAACPSQPGNLAMTSMIFAAVIWDADEPCSVKLRRLQSCLLQCPPEHVVRLSSF